MHFQSTVKDSWPSLCPLHLSSKSSTESSLAESSLSKRNRGTYQPQLEMSKSILSLAWDQKEYCLPCQMKSKRHENKVDTGEQHMLFFIFIPATSGKWERRVACVWNQAQLSQKALKSVHTTTSLSLTGSFSRRNSGRATPVDQK